MLKETILKCTELNDALVKYQKGKKEKVTMFDSVHEIENDVMASVYVDDSLYIGFQPSNDIQDWWGNFDGYNYVADEDQWYGRKIHWNFYESANAFKSGIQAIVNSILEDISDTGSGKLNNIITFGFSRGGAIAQTVAWYIAEHFPEMNTIHISWGAPPICGAAGVTCMIKLNNLEIIRFVNGPDPVSDTGKYSGLQHFGACITFHVSWWHRVLVPNFVFHNWDHYSRKTRNFFSDQKVKVQ